MEKETNVLIRNNTKSKEYEEFKLMVSLTQSDKKEVKVADFIFKENGKLKQISSELSKEKLKETLNEIIEENYTEYNK